MLTIVARVLCLFLVGVAVPDIANAQRSLDGSRRAYAECQARQNASPAFLALRHKIGSSAAPDIASSTDKATPEEARNLQILLRDHLMTCRQFVLEVAGARVPSIVPILKAAQAKEEVSYERLIAGQITWGQFTREMKADDAEFDAELRRHESAAEDESQAEPRRK